MNTVRFDMPELYDSAKEYIQHMVSINGMTKKQLDDMLVQIGMKTMGAYYAASHQYKDIVQAIKNSGSEKIK